MPWRTLTFFLFLILLSSCNQGGSPPSVTVITPAYDSVVSGNTAVQVTLGQMNDNAEVRVYARSQGGQETGQLIGTVNTSPYIVQWNTGSFPSNTPLEIYAKASVKGATGISQAVRVQVQNASAPTLKYMVAYNLPAGLSAQQQTRALHQIPDVGAIQMPANSAPVTGQQLLAAQGGLDRQLAVEWAWSPVDGADGYRVLLSHQGVAGPYDVVASQAAAVGGVALEKYSLYLRDQQVGDRVYGAVRSTTSGVDSAVSNGNAAIFLDAQQVASPIDGQRLIDGRPILTWAPLTGASGYLYFLCDRPCTQVDSKFIWTNYPYATPNLSATYPQKSAALTRGTYYWWVAGVRQERGVIVSLSYSEQRSLVVP